MASRQDYRIGWICALSIELATAKAMLDTIHPPLPNAKNDRNKYILGSIGPHNIVMTCLPAGVYGVTSATATAIQMRCSYDAIEICFMVGIAGGAPLEFDVRLGDIVVSEPTSIYGGVLQYGRGKAMNEGRIMPMGSLDKPPEVLLKALCALKADHMLHGHRILEFYDEAFERFPHLQHIISHPGTDKDHLFSPEYPHAISDPSCHQCDLSRVVSRAQRPDNQPRVFYGLIASGNMLVKDAKVRDQLSQQYGILCFETEAAGLMDIFPCLVIRGICDYADSHKNKRWQGYAAAVAAAYTKELTLSLPSHELASMALETAEYTPSTRSQEQKIATLVATENVPQSSPTTTVSSPSLKEAQGETVPATAPTPDILASDFPYSSTAPTPSQNHSRSPSSEEVADLNSVRNSPLHARASPAPQTELEISISLARRHSLWHPWPGDCGGVFIALKTWLSAPGSRILLLSPHSRGSHARIKDLVAEVTHFLIKTQQKPSADQRGAESPPHYQVISELSLASPAGEGTPKLLGALIQAAVRLNPDFLAESSIASGLIDPITKDDHEVETNEAELRALLQLILARLTRTFIILDLTNLRCTKNPLHLAAEAVGRTGSQIKFLLVCPSAACGALGLLPPEAWDAVVVPPVPPRAKHLKWPPLRNARWGSFAPAF